MGKTCVDFDRLAEAGVRAFTDDGKGLVDDGLMEQCLEASARLGLPILQHAEFPGHGGLLAPSNVQSQLKVGAYAEDAEVLMVERDLGLLKKHPEARYHVLHVSSGKTVERLRQAQQNGLKASGEASPHHLMYTVDEINPSDTSWKMNPPLRTLGDREALREGLRSGVLSFVATDHAPHESSAKGLGFQEAPFGTTGLEAMLKVLLNLHKNNELSVKRLVEVWSFMAARFFGFEGFGDLKVGDTFRAVWVDLDAPPRPLQTRDLQSLSKNSLFLGRQFPTEIRGVFNTKGFFRF
jgi:dihydroorotase